MMQFQHHQLFGSAAALVSLAIGVASARLSHAQEAAPVPPTPDSALAGAGTEGIETLTRGPVHEAFAAPSATEPEPAAVVAKKPPEPIDEIAPEFKPEGSIWIPGYWEWDVPTEDFLWISGLWRVPPPDMRWVPPYWTEAEGGWQRVPGFWISSDVSELEYREKPPAALEIGPSTPAPGENYFYIPGSWNYYDTGYRWRTGYWSPYRADWIWSPARWHWTPAGCVYGGGFWDRRPNVRGQLFAPIGFRSQVYLQPGFRYRPWCVVDTNRLFVNLWIGPRSNCYHFGNYYGGANRWGYSPWCNWNYRNRGCYDPIWSWSNTHYRRQGVDYIGRMQGWNRYYERNENDRPPRNWDEQRRQIAEGRTDRTKGQNIVANDLRELARRDDLPIRLAKLDERERDKVREVSDEIRELRNQRGRLEREVQLANNDGNNRPGRGDREPGEGRTGEGRTGEDRTGEARLDRPGRSDDDVARSIDRTGDKAGDKTSTKTGDDARSRTERRTTARIALPKPSTELERVTRGSNDSPRSLEGNASRGSDRTARTSERSDDRPGVDRADVSKAGTDRTRTDRAEVDRTRTDRTGDSGSDAASNLQDRIRASREAAESGRSGREAGEARSTERSTSRTERTETPRIERSETPRIERTETPRVDRSPTPRIERTETPRVERTETPQEESRRVETPRVERTEAPRVERAETPRVQRTETPRVESRRTETPRVESSRIETPRVERSTPRVETRRVETPRVERSSQPRVERSTPRVERSSPPRMESSRSSGGGSSSSSFARPSGSSSSRSESSRSSGSSSSRTSRGRDRD